MHEKIYLRVNLLICVPYITGWGDCFDLSNDCNGFCKCAKTHQKNEQIWKKVYV